MIKDWIEEKDSIHPNVLKHGALYFPDCDPDVVKATIDYLKSTKLQPSAEGCNDALFYVRMYKFAICLGYV